MKRISLILVAAVVGVTGMTIEPAWSANVKITPLGTHDGEFCRRDRAMLFEDPDPKLIVELSVFQRHFVCVYALMAPNF